MALTLSLLRTAQHCLGALAVCVALWPLQVAAQQQFHGQCTALGGDQQCIVSDASFMVQRGPNIGQTFSSGD